MSKRVFISRSAGPESTFRQRLEAAGFTVTGNSLVAFEPLAFFLPVRTDWIFFYSRRAAGYFIEELERQQQGYPQGVRTAAIGPGTAATLRKLGVAVDFVGNGRPEEVADAFRQVAAGASVLFPRAEHSRRSIARMLSGEIREVDCVVYRNRPVTAPDLPECDWLVFTSPLNARAWAMARAIDPQQRVVAIGSATAEALQQLGIADILTAREPSEEALAAIILQHEN